jgi:hypothetical protein
MEPSNPDLRGWTVTAEQEHELAVLKEKHGVAFVNEVYGDGGAQIVTQDAEDDRQHIYEVEQDGTTKELRS